VLWIPPRPLRMRLPQPRPPARLAPRALAAFGGNMSPRPTTLVLSCAVS